jgi:hypothetical protein
MMKCTSIFVLLLLLEATSLWGQGPPAPNDLGLVSLQGEGVRRNVAVYGLSFATDFDDNAASARGSVHNITYSLQPHIGLDLSRPRFDSRFDYFSGFSYSSKHIPGYDTVSQSLGTTLKYRMTKRLALTLRDTFTLTSSPFDSLSANASFPQFGILDRPNTSIPGTTIPRRMEQAGADIGYRVDARSSIGLGGTYMQLKYDGTNADPLLAGSQSSTTVAGNAYYSHQLTRRQSVSLRYTFQKIDSLHGQAVTRAHSALPVYDLAFTPALNLSLFAGPQYSDSTQSPASALVSSGVLRSKRWSLAGGSSFSWTGRHNGFTASFVRQISDGGGFGGSVRLESVSAQASHRLTRRSSINAFFNFNRNHELLRASSFDYLSGGAGYSRTLLPNLSLTLSYWHLEQSGTTSLVPLFSEGSHNRAVLSLSYQFEKPLGR